MKIMMIKLFGGGFIPANDMESDKLTKFKSGEHYEIEIVNRRNAGFHRKTWAFFNYCFEYWEAQNGYITERTSFDMFRKELIVLAGFREVYYKIDGSFRVEAQSISYASMSQDEFEQLYLSLIKVAMNAIFKGCDESEYDRLISFF